MRLCNSKTKTQELKTITWDVQNKHENEFLLCWHMRTWTWKKTWQDYDVRLCLRLSWTN
jgi:hypothetical protein